MHVERRLEGESVLDLMARRRTVRSFSPVEPARADVEQVIEAGMMAPYPIIGTAGSASFRKFFVLGRDSRARRGVTAVIQRYAALVTWALSSRIMRTLLAWIDSLLVGYRRLPQQYAQANDLVNQHVENTGHFAHMDDAPYLVIVAEESRGPLLANYLIRQSLGHCMQNMWLAATEKGLAFQPVSVSKVLGSNRAACRILGIQRNRYQIDAFLIGYPSKPVRSRGHRGSVAEDVAWL